VEFLALLWNEILLKPMLNSLIALYLGLFHNFGLAIIAFTVLIRLATLPLQLRQIRQMQALSQLQPKLQELQKRYAKDRQKLSEETMRLYREHGISPVGCLGPMLVQFPIWIALYQALIQALSTTPERFFGLARYLYPWLPAVHSAIPLNSRFLWLDLGLPDRTPVLPLLVGVSMWALQRMSTPSSSDPRQQQTNQMMLWFMPLFFILLTFQFPSGLALYWVVSNLLGMVIQGSITGWGNLLPRRGAQGPARPAGETPSGETKSDGAGQKGQRGDERPNRRRGGGTGPEGTGGKPGRGDD